MKANPGGQIAISEILGRDKLIRSLWDILAQQSVVLNAERRIGKTCVIRKMEAQPPTDWVPVLQDLERIHSANEFAIGVYAEVRDFLSKWDRAANKAKEFFRAIGGTEFPGGLKLPTSKEKHWKTLLIKTVEDLVSQQSPKKLVFFWDEMPYMLDGIRRREGEDTAMEVLDVLRSLRHEYQAGFRMVLTGSIGLHHVLTTLKRAGYSNEPVNDMHKEEVPQLAPADARELAGRLIEGEELTGSDMAAAVRCVADEADCVPFYIHHVVRYLKINGLPAEPDQIKQCVARQMLDPNDPWELRHYRDRIKTYYPGDERPVTAILDVMSVADGPAAVDAILQSVKAQMEFDDREHLLELLRLLARDHYLSRTDDGGYRFRFSLIQRWWKLDRGL